MKLVTLLCSSCALVYLKGYHNNVFTSQSHTNYALTARATWALHNAWHMIANQQMFHWERKTQLLDITQRQWPFNNKAINCLLNTYSRKALVWYHRESRKNKTIFALNSLP